MEHNIIVHHLCLWAIIGFFAVKIVVRNPKTKRKALIMLFLSGPLCWIIFLFVSIPYFKKKPTMSE